MSWKRKANISNTLADISESSSSLARLKKLLAKQADIQQKQFQKQQLDFQLYLATQFARQKRFLNEMMVQFQHRFTQMSLNADLPHNDHEGQDFEDDASEICTNMNHPPRYNGNYAPSRHQLHLQGREHIKWESCFKLDVPEFHRTHNAKYFLDWLNVM